MAKTEVSDSFKGYHSVLAELSVLGIILILGAHIIIQTSLKQEMLENLAT